MKFLGRSLRAFGLVACFFGLVGCPLLAQNPVSPAASNPPPKFHTASRLVVVNVVVTDRDGKQISGLKKEDFQLFEDGKAQPLLVFESHETSSQPSAAPHLHPGADEQTTIPTLAGDGAINVILFDMLNTAAEDQRYARQELSEFLETLPQGQWVALFTLNDGSLRLVGDFTTPTQDMIAAINDLHPDVSSLLLDRSGERRRVNNVYSTPSAAYELPLNAAYDWPSNGNTLEQLAQEESSIGYADRWWADMRAHQTFDAMGEIASALSGYAGRKNLLWLSGGFPGTLPPNLKERRFEPFDYLAVFQKYSGKLESSQISVYPIDVRGVKSTGRPGIPNSSDYVFAAMDSQRAMDEIAAQTGGRAFYNTNDVTKAMEHSIEHGTIYYTLAYSPRNQKWNGAFRRITVSMQRPSAKLDYREGYYATKDLHPRTSR